VARERLMEERRSQEEDRISAQVISTKEKVDWQKENKEYAKKGLVMKSLARWAAIVDFGESNSGKQAELEAMAKVDGVWQIKWVDGVPKVYELVFGEADKLDGVARSGLMCGAVNYPVHRCLRKDSRMVMVVVDGYLVEEEEDMEGKLAEAWQRWGDLRECRKRMWRGCEVWNGQVECVVELQGEVGMDKGWQGWITLGGNSLKAWREEEVGGGQQIRKMTGEQMKKVMVEVKQKKSMDVDEDGEEEARKQKGDKEVTTGWEEPEAQLMDVEETMEELSERMAELWERRKRNLELRTTLKSLTDWGKEETEEGRKEKECTGR